MDTLSGDKPMDSPRQPPLAGLDPAALLQQGAAEDTLGPEHPFQPPGIDEMAGIFPQFEILELIGKGGMGAVYKVRQKELDRIVALKILPPAIGGAPGFSERFTREAKALAKLNHPGIVTLHEFGQQDGLHFILMEFVDGVNLAQLMKTGRISPREALAIVPQICDALQYAHDQGIVHRDIKPENILLDRLGRVKVADFGIAKVVAAVCEDPIRSGDTPVPADQTLAGKIMGTPQYMAPEQIDHPSDVDHRADIYALGVVFYQMLTGELPDKDLQAPSRKVRIDVRLDEIVLKALEKNPELRYQQASAMRTRVETVGNNLEKVPESEMGGATFPQRDKVVRWVIHLIWAACASGLIALAITFVAEVLTKDRGDLNQSLMTWEDVYGPVIMVLLGGGLLAIPIKAFRFASPRVWIGAVFATAAITAIAYVLAAPVEDNAFHSENFIVAVAMCALGTFLCGFAAVFGKEELRGPYSTGHLSPPGSKKLKWIVAACVVTGVAWLVFRNSGTSYPASSLSPRYKAPVMGRIEFKFTHPESLGGKAVSYPVKKWGDTQWKPSSGNQITLKSGRTLLVKSRVNAIRPDVPVAMVTTSSGDSGWETQELKIDGIAPVRNLVFANGLRVEIQWTPMDLSEDRTKAPDPTQQQVMLLASKESDRKHPVSVDTEKSAGTSGTPTGNRLADYLWEDMGANDLPTDGVRQTVDGRTVLKIENLKNAPKQARLLTIENPPIKAMRYAVSGEIRYENIQGQGYMEMWSVFPEGRYFSRTLETSGPLGQLTGTSGWRKFTLPFDRTGTKDAPGRIEVNLHLPGRGVVFVGPLELVELEPDKTADGRATAPPAIIRAEKPQDADMVDSGGAISVKDEISFRELPASNRLQIRRVAPDDPQAVDAVQIQEDGTRTTLKLSDNVVVCDRHVEDAGIQGSGDGYGIMVTLNEVGEKRLAAATKGADGNMRLAVIVDGEVKSAPLVMNPLGRHFTVVGFRDPEECLGLVKGLVEWPDDHDLSAMKGWLEQVDQGNAGEAWSVASEYLRQNLPREKFGEMITAARQPLGEVVTRRLFSAKRLESPPGAPDGLYLVSEFDSTFKNKKEARETVTLLKEKDGRWRNCGYFIR